MTVDERKRLAAEKTERIIDSMRTILQLRSNNEVLLYSDLISKQVPESFAANAFNVLTSALFEAELVRVCALWDAARSEKEARDRDSIPAVAWLINNDTVIEGLAQAIKDGDLRAPNHPWEDRYSAEEKASLDKLLRQSIEQEAEKKRGKALRRAHAVVERIANVEAGDLHKSLRNFRDKHVAHALVETQAERRGKVVPPKYGDEVKLFETSIEVVNELNYVVRNASFVWQMAQEQTKRCSLALWSGCKLNITE